MAVVGCRVGARVSGSQEGGDGLTGSARSMVEEGRQRVMAVGLLPSRRRVLLAGVGDHEDAVEIDYHLAVGVRGVLATNDQTRPRTSDRFRCSSAE